MQIVRLHANRESEFLDVVVFFKSSTGEAGVQSRLRTSAPGWTNFLFFFCMRGFSVLERIF